MSGPQFLHHRGAYGFPTMWMSRLFGAPLDPGSLEYFLAEGYDPEESGDVSGYELRTIGNTAYVPTSTETLPYPLAEVEVGLWDGSTRWLGQDGTAMLGIPSGSATRREPCVGPGSPFPLGLPLEAAWEWYYRVRKFRVSMTYSVQGDTASTTVTAARTTDTGVVTALFDVPAASVSQEEEGFLLAEIERLGGIRIVPLEGGGVETLLAPLRETQFCQHYAAHRCRKYVQPREDADAAAVIPEPWFGGGGVANLFTFPQMFFFPGGTPISEPLDLAGGFVDFWPAYVVDGKVWPALPLWGDLSVSAERTTRSYPSSDDEVDYQFRTVAWGGGNGSGASDGGTLRTPRAEGFLGYTETTVERRIPGRMLLSGGQEYEFEAMGTENVYAKGTAATTSINIAEIVIEATEWLEWGGAYDKLTGLPL